MTPFFTILVPVYNHDKFVGLALDSLLAQTDPDWEACVIDDGSTDGTPAILDDYARRDSRIRVFHKPNGGEASALNAAWREAKGSWINWLSSDDLFLPHKLAVQREWIKTHATCRYFFTDFQTLDDATGLIKGGYTAHTPTQGMELIELLAANYINGIAMCVHRVVFETVGAFDEASQHGQDYDFHLRAVARYAPIRIPVITCVQRTHPGQLSRQRTQAMLYDCAASAIRFLNTLDPDIVMGAPSGLAVEVANRKLEEALSVAASPNSYLNLMGPHPTLVMHLVTWVARAVRDNPAYRPLISMMGRKARTTAWMRSKELDAGFWQALSVLCDLSALPASVGSIRVEDVLDASWSWTKARCDERAVPLAEYAAYRQKREMTGSFQAGGTPLPPVIWIPLTGKGGADEGDVLRIAGVLVESGIPVVVLRWGQPSMTWHRGLLTLTVPHPGRAMMALAITPGDPVVMISPGQRTMWWWRQVWRVVDAEPTTLADISKESAVGVLTVFRKRICRLGVRCLGYGFRLGKRLVVACKT